MLKTIFWKVLLLLLFLNMPVFATAQGTSHASLHTLQVGEIERSYHLYQPTEANGKLVIVLHPLASSGLAMEAITGLNDFAEENGFTVVYPNAAGFYWDDGRSDAGIPPDEGAVDDLGFLSALIDELVREQGVDPEQVYLAGFGNGGTMAYSAACQQPQQYAGVMVVSALMWSYQPQHCPDELEAPPDLVILYGDHDHIYWQLGRTFEGIDGWYLMGASETHEWWRDAYGCQSTERSDDLLIATHSDCRDEATIQFLRMPSAGNIWPRMGENVLNRFEVDASEILTAFVAGNDLAAVAIPEESPSEDIVPRTYLLYVPTTYDPAEAMPMVFLLHGRHSNAPSQAYTSDMNRIAEREGFIAVYPEGYDPNMDDPVWQYGRGVLMVDNNADVVNDEEFLGTLIDDLGTSLNINPGRVYVTGLSNGGFMTQRLACTMSDRF
ncbi:MAG: hypothetical protein KC496_02035, partial [Anaerolineae bacterium]|nr:hypothetical protein [Anaerolineae bacterium]